MRISDWRSDVCSSDLDRDNRSTFCRGRAGGGRSGRNLRWRALEQRSGGQGRRRYCDRYVAYLAKGRRKGSRHAHRTNGKGRVPRSEERRGGKGSGSKGKCRGAPNPEKKKNEKQ